MSVCVCKEPGPLLGGAHMEKGNVSAHAGGCPLTSDPAGPLCENTSSTGGMRPREVRSRPEPPHRTASGVRDGAAETSPSTTPRRLRLQAHGGMRACVRVTGMCARVSASRACA